ncbi:hypothetical protein AGR6A_Lc90435 [Agrobacterium sp. NCPPB 925]|nr:hypothetical protein AGR6A_Lc90435 [Agrobacterium sp. NCPPB 925]
MGAWKHPSHPVKTGWLFRSGIGLAAQLDEFLQVLHHEVCVFHDPEALKPIQNLLAGDLTISFG